MQTLFGPSEEWPHQDLVAFSEEFDAALAVAGYAGGLFPMPLSGVDADTLMGWWSPMHRAQLPTEALRVTRSLRQSTRRYTTTVDVAFDDVLARCGDPARPDGWIDSRIRRVFTELHHEGLVHSVETWDAGGRLVGGLYGIHVRGMFAGESMFHDADLGRDASKVALLRLLVELQRCNVDLLDVQWLTPHLATLGAVEVDREDYLDQLVAALAVEESDAWSTGEDGRLSGTELLALVEGL